MLLNIASDVKLSSTAVERELVLRLASVLWQLRFEFLGSSATNGLCAISIKPAPPASMRCFLSAAMSMYIHSIDKQEQHMIVEFCKWGNSLAVRIPKPLADAIKASNGKRAEIKVENGTLVLRPIVKPARKSRYTLDELLSGMTRNNVPQEVDWGPQRGNEAW
jgi:antitoxin MazE